MTLLLAAAIAVGVPPLVIGMVVAAVNWPLPAAGVVLALAARARRQFHAGGRTDPEVAALVAIADELRAGAGLRQAIAEVAGQMSELEAARRLALAGRPMNELAPVVGEAFSCHGSLVAAALRLASDVGGRMAPLFDELAGQVIDAEELRRERRVAATPAIAQGAIVGGIPVLAIAQMAVTGRLAELAGSGTVGAGLVIVGVSLTVLGIAWVGWLVWRVGR